ncbi:MAG: helix-turn-helix transcriptional regulator [Actinocatenispora sp.]
MTATERDRLREILDLVVASVSEPDAVPVRGADLARRAYLSRYHFDRLVTAALGEPPGAFRRRLLLERAAYQLRVTTEPVTSIAFLAGYSSLEGFTRAFGRAYGRAPSALRADRAARTALAAPNGIHFHPPGGLRLPADARRAPMDVTTTLLEHDHWLVGELLDRAATLTDEQLDRPITLNVESVDDDMTLRLLLDRLVSTKERWTAVVEGRRVPGGDPLGSELGDEERTVPALRRRYAVAGPEFLSLTAGIRDRGEENVTFIDTSCEPPETFSYGGMIAHVLNFSAHRRTLAVGALYTLGVTDLGAGDPRRFADET